MTSESSAPGPRQPLPRPLALLLLVVFVAILIRTAWISDDAEISLRSVLNVTHGFGLTFNVAERVQTFTHPLWLLWLVATYVVVGNIYYTAIVASLVVSVAVFWLVITRAASPAQAWMSVIVLAFSRAFVDFSGSGLENPLTHLLLVASVAVFVNDGLSRSRWLALQWTLASLLYLTRPDAVLLVVPLLLVASARVRPFMAVARAVCVGLAPALAWTIFATIYYGFPFPNTAYAKLANGIPRPELWHQGVIYLIDSIDRDPLTLVAIVFGIGLGVTTRGPVARAAAAGVALYLIYIVSIGGDFMAGRFLSAPLMLAVLILGRLVTAPSPAAWYASAAVLAVVGTAGMRLPLYSNSRFDETAVKPNGVVDERAVYFRDRSLMLANRRSLRDPGWPVKRGTRTTYRIVDTCGLMGQSGLVQGPYAHLLDECALADPLLARLPAIYNEGWRAGHYRRLVPNMYRESLEAGTNQLADPALRDLYEQIRLVTRSDSWFSADRLRAILSLNFGRAGDAVDRFYYRHGGVVARLPDLASPREDGTPRDAEGVRTFDVALAVPCEERVGRQHLDISVASDAAYRLTFLRKDRYVAQLDFGPIPEHRRQPGLATYTLDLPPRAIDRGFDTIVVSVVTEGASGALGHLLLDGHAATDGELRRRVEARDAAPRRLP